MSETTKIKEAKPTETTNVKKKRFTVTINTPAGKKFLFTGPEVATTAEKESVVYALFSEIIIQKWRENLIKDAKKKEEDKVVEDKKSEDDKK